MGCAGQNLVESRFFNIVILVFLWLKQAADWTRHGFSFASPLVGVVAWG